jgi:hypothetical protein
MQYDLEMAAQDLASKKQQCEELATGVSTLQVSDLLQQIKESAILEKCSMLVCFTGE